MEHSFFPQSHGFNPLVGTASWSDKTLLDCGKFYPHAVFNNCMEDKSQLNAREFLDALKAS
ncbi:MAG: hypothetical protein ABS43_28620 [Bordetella sp. SCN 67-23]|uniref:hypothetical protein n=1 Tax=Acidovorax sp. TaxID=1872122 RepID=UPI00086DB1F4|nr:hypothetical protein [Acidovorax sp.]MBN9626039.1 hypothetical protein [Acidovorax sp.]ODS68250.1 MAG: hypothetical protein ABS43_28620 [Bordetella sp. SCN 67-23]